MPNLAQCDDILKKLLAFDVAELIFGIVLLALILWALCKKETLFGTRNKVVRIVLQVLTCAVMCVLIVTVSIDIHALHDDLKNQSYIVYEGEFAIEENVYYNPDRKIGKYRSGYDITMQDEEKTNVHVENIIEIAPDECGTYRGSFVYSAKSKRVLEFGEWQLLP